MPSATREITMWACEFLLGTVTLNVLIKVRQFVGRHIAFRATIAFLSIIAAFGSCSIILFSASLSGGNAQISLRWATFLLFHVFKCHFLKSSISYLGFKTVTLLR